MEASLSVEEFQRMQEQLIDLRTKNYVLGEKNVKIQTELLQNNKFVDDLQKEVVKCQKIINRSKNAKDVELFIQENDALQKKLQMQEDEFRLQNETLMQEVASLIALNKNAVKELELFKSQNQIPSNSNEEFKIKLEAENKALKLLIENFENNADTNSDEGNVDPSQNIDLKIKLSTINEEKLLLQQNMKKVENEYGLNLLEKQNEIIFLKEKLKKKQESFFQLQSEREKLYNENKKTIENLEMTKDAEIQQLKDQMKIVQLDLRRALLNEHSAGNLSDETSDHTVEFLGETAIFDCSLNETKQSVAIIEVKLQTLNWKLSESEEKIKNMESCNRELELKIEEYETKNLKLEELLDEKNKLAEQRKKLIDEMNDHLLETTTKHSMEIESLTKKLEAEQEAFKKLFDKEKETQLKLAECNKDMQLLKIEVEKFKTNSMISDKNISKLEEKLVFVTQSNEKILHNKDIEHSQALECIKTSLNEKIKDLGVELELARAEKCEYEEKIVQLQQEAKDSIDDRKIQEKKGLSMVKDLKRQLQMERNRGEKLQERLQEILNQQSQPFDEILQSSNVLEKNKGDTSSISSWSYVSGGTAERENKDATLQSDTSSGGHESPNHGSSLLENETSSLLSKIANLQQKSWTLEEKVNHLELSNEALVDDVLKKTAIIQFYCMEGRSESHLSGAQDKLTIKRIVDFIKDRGDENLKEMNRRMQRMLEETLTKNMHLQKDIETLSNEISRLSKLACPNIENTMQSTCFIDNVKN